MSIFFFVFYWWCLLFLLGVIFLPLTLTLFHRFFDKGWFFSKILALLIVSYAIWLLGSFKVLPFTSQVIWLIILLAAGANGLIFRRKPADFKKQVESGWKIFALEEGLFFASLMFWSLVRSHQPDIHGLEKYMDYGFVNSILRSRFFPPADMWLAGETINYYYFGHLISAVLTKLSGVDSAVSYNLMMASTFAFTFTGAFSLGGNLKNTFYLAQGSSLAVKIKQAITRPRLLPILAVGILTAFLTALGGNLHPLYWYLKNKNFDTYWYPDATRFIVEKFGAADNTIHEFPVYSFVVADLHGHMINLANVFLIIALILALFQKIIFKKKVTPWSGSLLLLSLCLAIAFMTNAWDYPIYLSIAGLSLLLANWLRHQKDLIRVLINTGRQSLTLLFASIILMLPFHLHFENIAQGISKVDFHSPGWMLAVLWGFPLFMTLAFGGLFWSQTKLKLKNLKKQPPVEWLILGFLIIAWLLILAPEIIRVKDIYIHSHQRANTMFKLTYQSFVIFYLVTGYTVFRILASFKTKILKFLFVLLVSGFFFFIFSYPRFAIRSYYNFTTPSKLNGIEYLRQNYADDYEAILWLKKNVSGQPVITEAVGESYTDFARVSANTGLPAVLGWRVHEWLWRGSFDEAAKRTEEVRAIYESDDLDQTKQFLKKYQVRLIFIGTLEKQQYPQLDEGKFSQLGEVVFTSGEVKIYEINY